MAEISIYKRRLNDDTFHPNPASFTFSYWTPDWRNFKPAFVPPKYFMYWLFHLLGIFKNKHYAAILIHDKQKLVSGLLIVPSYFRWPFMNINDVQLTYVVTNPDYRGRGLAKSTVKYALNILKQKEVQNVWYVTDTENIASIRVCESAGFRYVGKGIRKTSFGGIIKQLFLKENQRSATTK